MKRRFLALAFGGGLIAVLVLLLWRHTHAPQSRARPLFSLSPAAITRLDARWSSGKRIALQRDSDGWHMTAPVLALADPTRVNAFLAALDEPISRSYTPASVPLTSAGLVPAQLVLTVNHTEAALGRLNPTNKLRYIRRDHQVFLVADTLLPRLAAGPWQFISTRLLPPDAQVTGIRIGPHDTAHNPRLLVAWQQAHAVRVGPTPSPAPEPVTHIRITLAPPAGTLGYDVLSRNPLTLSRPGSGLAYTFSPAAASRLLATRARTTGS